jgi:hypothetical protein
MTRKVYRTAQGKLVDLGRLQLQNENTRAVGNMGVNARGDKVDSMNRPIERKPTQVQRQYNRQTAATTETTAPPTRPKAKIPPAAEIPAPPEDFQDDFQKEDQPQKTTGLAAAIAKAREIRQEPLRTPQQVAQEQEGVRKI